jgi:nitroreductase
MEEDMTFIDLLQTRLGTRAVSPEPLPRDVIDKLVQAAGLAPSCYNKQPWRYLFLSSPEALAKGREVLSEGNRVWAGRAPLLVLAWTRRAEDCVLQDGRAYHQFDLGLSVMSLMLQATELGLAARPMAGFNAGRAREVFELDEDTEPLVMLAIGRPSQEEGHLPEHYRGAGLRPRERKPASDIVRHL